MITDSPVPYNDPEKRRAANAERMRRRRAAGSAWVDPTKEAERKARWYHEQGGKERITAATRARRQEAREQGMIDFQRRLNDET